MDLDYNLLDKIDIIGLDPQQQIRTLQHFEEMKSSEFGWQICIKSLSSKSFRNEHAYFFALQVLEHYAKNRHAAASIQNQQLLRDFLCQWPQIQLSHSSSSAIDRGFIRNKVAQILALVFVQDFPVRWSTFFSDLQSTFHLGDPAIDYYLRTLSAIDSEIADREIPRTNQEIQRNNVIKNAIRENAVLGLTDSWYHILTTYLERGPSVACQCLHVIGSYVQWIDISLIANDRFVPILVKQLSSVSVREAAADCIQNIITKGMDHLLKSKMIESFSNVLNKAAVWQEIQNGADSEFVVKLGKLVNVMGVSLIDAFNNVTKSPELQEPNSSSAIVGAIEDKIDLMLQFLENPYDDVSASVFEFTKDYLHFLKAKALLTENEIRHFDNTLLAITKKIRYDEEYNFEQEGENEALFLEYRKELRTLMDNLAQIDIEKVINHTRNIVEYTLPNWRKLPFEDIEAALFLLYMLGETVPVHKFMVAQEKVSPIQSMCMLLTTSDVQLHSHPAVVLQYFETVVRYERFYAGHPDYILPVLTSFLKENGLFHPSKKVRSRSVYLFSRFIKSIRGHLTALLTRDILRAVQPLLAIATPLQDCNMEPLLSDDDQLYVFEVVGIVIVSGEKNMQKRADYMREAVSPLLEACKGLTEQLVIEEDSIQKDKMANMIVQAISVSGRLSKAFSNQSSMKACGSTPTFLEALQVFLQCIEILNGAQQSTVQSAVRQYLHRMVVCLQEEILPYIPIASQCLLKNCDSRTILEYLPLINQVIAKFKLSWLFQKEISPFLREMFAPMVQSIFSVLAQPYEPNDENAVRERQTLQGQYIRFIAVIVTNNLTDVLESQDPILLQQVMQTIIQGCLDFPDPIGQTSCFTILRKLVELWGGQEGPEGFVNFMYKNIVPACFMAPAKSSFDMNDAQTSLVVSETSSCLKSILEKRKEEFVIYLQNHYLPTLELSPQKIIDYLQALQGPPKEFKLFLKTFFQRNASQNR